MAELVIGVDVPLSVVCGQLLAVGFDGTTLPDDLRADLAKGERGGVVLFKRNITFAGNGGDASTVDLAAVATLNASIADAAPRDMPPVIAIDQEGGRVKRLGPPTMQLPPMRELGALGDPALVQAIGRAVGIELAALGFDMSFAPVLDVDSNPANPVIGDRSFGTDPRTVMRMGVAYVRGLQSAGVLACGKHFPGHGDTETDSHLGLPRVKHSRKRLDEIEIPPFRAAVGAGVAAVMTAHVVYDALDAGGPATLSRAVVGSLLRAELGFQGVCISDDLCMQGVSPSAGKDPNEVANVAIEAVAAGCDLLLICSEPAAQRAAHAALVARAEKDARFKARCAQSFERLVRIKRLAPPRPITDAARLAEIVGGPTSREAMDRLNAAMQVRASR
jgi:beta-N-acetylhexosaminidase